MSQTFGKLFPFVVVFLLFPLFSGCESSGPIKPRAQSDSELLLSIISNRDLNQTHTIARVQTEGSTNRSADVLLDSEIIPYRVFLSSPDSLYYKSFNNFRRYLPGLMDFSFDDNEGNTLDINIPSVDSFSITDIAPGSRIANGNQPVVMSWSGASGASNYVLAAVRRPLKYTGVGYSQFVTSGTTSETLNQAAFFQTDGVNPDTGWYDLYVYAIAASPDSLTTRKLLPVPLPDEFGQNLALTNLTGRYGFVSVSRRDSVRIAIQP
jgi:hypothetical protein